MAATVSSYYGKHKIGEIFVFNGYIYKQLLFGVSKIGKASTASTKSSSTTSSTSTGKSVDNAIQYYIPATTISFEAKMLKPNTKVYPFFDTKNVSAYVTPSGGVLGGELITNSLGEISGTFAIPNNASIKFLTGLRVFKLTDSSTNSTSTTSAQASYICSGNNDNATNNILSLSTIDSSTDSSIFDPMIQTFFVNETGGIFVTKVDAYFNTKDSTYPIICQLRTVSDDKVSSVAIPDSSIVLNPSDISTSGATTIEFKNPIYLQDGIEYALVFVSNSNNYSLHTCEYGKTNSNNLVSTKDPRIGTIMKFVTETEWKRDSSYGIKFNLYKATFDTATSHTITLNNADIGTKTLDSNPLSVGSSSNLITVYDEEHSFNIDSFVTISGIPTGTYGGISSTELNAVHRITAITSNTYSFDNYYVGSTETTITTSTSAASFGGSAVVSDIDYQYNNIVLNFEELELPETSLSYEIKTTTGQSIDGNETPYIQDTTNSSIITADTFTTPNIKKIASTYNEDNSALAGSKSTYVYATFSSDNENISPVIDKSNLNAIIIENLINNDSTDETEAQHGNSLGRYITKEISLIESAIGLRVVFDAVVQANASVEVYYKTLGVDESVNIESKDWNLMPLEDSITYSSDANDYQTYKFIENDISDFKSFIVKIVMLSSNSSQVPKIMNFRAIALGS